MRVILDSWKREINVIEQDTFRFERGIDKND